MKKNRIISMLLIIIFCITFTNFNVLAEMGEWNGGFVRNFTPQYENKVSMSSWLEENTYDLGLESYENLKKPAYRGEVLLSIIRMYQEALEDNGLSRIYPIGYELDKFEDKNSVPSSPAEELKVAVRLGMLNGIEYDRTLYMKVGDYVTRAQVAQILYMFSQNTDDFGRYRDYSNNFDDIQGHWAYEAIVYCYEAGILDGKGGYYDPEGEVKKEEVIQILCNIRDNSNDLITSKNVASAINKTFCITTVFDRVDNDKTSIFESKVITPSKRYYRILNGQSTTVSVTFDNSRRVTAQLIDSSTNNCCEITSKYSNGSSMSINIKGKKVGMSVLELKYTDGSSYERVYVPIYVVNNSGYYIPVDTLSLTSKRTISLDVGDRYYLDNYVSVRPNDATNSEVFYSSSNPNIASVNYTSGVVTANYRGTAKIYVVTDGKEQQIQVTVSGSGSSSSIGSIASGTSSFYLSRVRGTVDIDHTYDVSDYVYSNYSNVTYSCSSTSYASVNSRTGVVIPKREGIVTIYVKSGNKTLTFKLEIKDDYYYDDWYDEEYDNISRIELDYNRDTVYAGDTFYISDIITVYPKTYSTDTLRYLSSDTSVAKVSTSGLVTTKGGGEAVITITSYSGVRAKFYLYVEEVDFEEDDDGFDPDYDPILPSNSDKSRIEFGLDEISLNVGDGYNLASILLYSTANKVKFTSSDETKLKISDTNVIAIENSSEPIIITATNSDGKTAKLKVYINE